MGYACSFCVMVYLNDTKHSYASHTSDLTVTTFHTAQVPYLNGLLITLTNYTNDLKKCNREYAIKPFTR